MVKCRVHVWCRPLAIQNVCVTYYCASVTEKKIFSSEDLEPWPMTLIFELDLYRIKMNCSSMTVTWVKGNLVQKSGHTDTHTTYPQVYLDHVVENWLKSWYAVTFEHAAEQRFPRSAEVNTASDLNKIPPIHGVGALSKVDVAQRIRLYTIITSHWHKRILSLTADTGWKIKYETNQFLCDTIRVVNAVQPGIQRVQALADISRSAQRNPCTDRKSAQ